MAESGSDLIGRVLATIARIADGAKVASKTKFALRSIEMAAIGSGEAFAQALDELGMLVRNLCPACRQRYANAAAAAENGSYESVAEIVEGMCCGTCRQGILGKEATRIKRDTADRQETRRAQTKREKLLPQTAVPNPPIPQSPNSRCLREGESNPESDCWAAETMAQQPEPTLARRPPPPPTTDSVQSSYPRNPNRYSGQLYFYSRRRSGARRVFQRPSRRDCAGEAEGERPCSLQPEQLHPSRSQQQELSKLPPVKAVDGVMIAEREEKEKVFSGAPSSVRAVLDRPWPSPVVILPEDSPSGKVRTLVATAGEIGDPISPEELAALEDMEGDDASTRFYKSIGRADAVMRNYIHEHGCLYLDEKYRYIVDNSAQAEELRCKNVTVEEMEAKLMNRKVTKEQAYLSELALASFNKRKKVKFEFCKALISRTFWEYRGLLVHINFVAKRNGKKTLFFSEIEERGQGGKEKLEVRCCIPLESLCEGGYYYDRFLPTHGNRKYLDFTRCYACTEFLKHPADGSIYSGGHDYRRKIYLV